MPQMEYFGGVLAGSSLAVKAIRDVFMNRLLLLCLSVLGLASAACAEASLKLVADVPLTGSAGRFDYQSIDRSRLYISAMGAGSVVVFDMAVRREIATLPDFPGATGIATVPALQRVFVSVTGHWWNAVIGGGELAAIDTTSLKTAWRVPAGTFPDGITFIPREKRLFVSDERGEQVLVFDAGSGHQAAALPLGGEAGMSAFDPVSERVLVNVQSRNEIAVIDPAALRIERRIALPGQCRNNHGLLIEASTRRAFVACDESANLLVVDLDNGQVIQTVSVGNKPDVLTLDPVRARLYVASESGVVSVFNVKPKRIEKLVEGLAGENAHSVAVDPESGLLYLPLRNLNGRPVLRIMEYR